MSDDSTERTRLSSFCVQLTVHLSHGCRTVSLVGDVTSRTILARAEVVQHFHQPFFLFPFRVEATIRLGCVIHAHVC